MFHTTLKRHQFSGLVQSKSQMLLSKWCSRCVIVTLYNWTVTLAFYMYLQESDNLWWDAFATEFFEDDASLTLTFCLEDGPKRYSELHAKKKKKERKCVLS